MSAPPAATMGELLRRARGGDRAAVHELIERNLPWLRARVRRRLGAELRRELDSGDLVNEVVLSLLGADGRVEVRDEDHFKALLVRVVDADVRDRVRFQRRECRDRGREHALLVDGGSTTGTPLDSVTRPSHHLDRQERVAWIRAAMLRMAPDDRRILRRRIWDQAPFHVLAAELGIAEDAARMRVNRALSRLAQAVSSLRAGVPPSAGVPSA